MALLILISLCFTCLVSCERMARGKIYVADKNFYDDGTREGGLFFLRHLNNSTVYDWDGESFVITPPESFKKKKLAWGCTYFTGMKRKSTKPEVFYLVGDYDSSSFQIVFDKNGNTDFRDDSILSITPGKWADVRINNHFDKEACINMNFLFTQKAPDSLYRELFTAFTFERKDGISPQIITTDANRYYRKVHLPGGNIITLWDLNVNGFFDDKGDKIIAGDIQTNKKIRHSLQRTKNVKYGVVLPFGNKTYELIEVDKYGNSVELVDLNKTSDTSETMQPFNFLNEKNKWTHFNFKTGTKFTVFYIWGSWCLGCWTQAPMLVKLMDKYENKVQFYSFNHGDPVERMNQYLQKTKHKFKPWRIDNRNISKLNPDGFPHYILLDQNRRVLLRTLQVQDIEAFLDKNKF